MSAAAPTPRWFQFRLRTLLAAVTLLAVFLAWLGYQANWIRERRVIFSAPKQYNVFQAMGTEISTSGTVEEHVCTTNAPWLGWFGEEGQLYLAVNASKSEVEIARIRNLFPEAEIELVPEDEIDPSFLADRATQP